MEEYIDQTRAPAQSEPEAEQAAPEAAQTPEPALPKKAPRLNEAVPEAAGEQTSAERVTVCDVQFRSGSKVYYFDPGKVPVRNGDHLIIDTARGAEYGICVGGPHRVTGRELVQPLRKVLRLATAIDERIKADNERLEKEAYEFCQRKVEELGLDMQLVSAECAFDGTKLLFYFTADARVDFRELVKVLAANYHTRIELRQIGVRDKAKLLGGLGICGRPFCCASFLDDFQPVSIKMAKTQNLSLNPTKISGTCGRLMCCLKYEQDAYEDLIQTSPKAESFVDTPDGRGTVTAVNLMRQSVNVRMESDPEEIRCFKNCDICVLRSGKAKKNDPPIPDDLAPISGGRDPEALLSRADQRIIEVREEELEPEELPVPEQPPRKQGKEKPVAELPAQPEPPVQQEKKRDGKRRSRGRKAPKPQEPETRLPAEPAEKQPKTRQKKPGQNNRRQDQKKQPQSQKPAAPAPAKEQVQPEQPKKNNRRRYYHHRNKGSGGAKG